MLAWFVGASGEKQRVSTLSLSADRAWKVLLWQEGGGTIRCWGTLENVFFKCILTFMLKLKH